MIADPTVRANPIPAYERIRTQGRLDPHPNRLHHGGLRISHAVLRSDDFSVTSITTNVPPWIRWVERGREMSAMHPLEEPSLLSIEPPDHTRYRALVSSVFTARAVARLSDRVASTADTLLDEIATATGENATTDIIDAYCAILPVAVISDLLGVRAADRRLVLELGELVAPSLDVGLPYRGFRDTEMGLRRFHVWLGGHLAELRRNPGDDLISQLIQASLDGRPLTDRELRATAGLVLVAGFETTVNLLGNGVRLLLDHPEQLRVLEANPMQWPNAVDEILRLESPFSSLPGYAGGTPRSPDSRSAPASRSLRSLPPRIVIPPCSPIRMRSTSPEAMPGGTSRSQAVGTTVSALRWRGPKAR